MRNGAISPSSLTSGKGRDGTIWHEEDTGRDVTSRASPLATGVNKQTDGMRESRSCVLKMLCEDKGEGRRVATFPRAYRQGEGRGRDFSPGVREACRRGELLAPRMAKVVVVGDVAVGKTCLINRFCHSVFDGNYKATIGVDFEVESFTVLGVPFNLQIWDTAGQERFRSIASSYYRGAHAVVVVFDLSDLSSLANASRWMGEALAANRGEPVRLLVGTKKDLLSEAALEKVEGHARAAALRLGAEQWAVSSRSGENVGDFFARTAALAFEASVAADLLSGGGAVRVGRQLGAESPRGGAEAPRRGGHGCQGCASS